MAMEPGTDAKTKERMVADILSELNSDDREAAIEELQGILRRLLFHMGLAETDAACPKCGSAHRVKNGRTRKGTQRFLCKGCGCTFCDTDTGDILLYTKLPPEKWMDFAECFVDGLSIEKTRLRIGVSHPTAWFMRVRTMEALFANLPSFEAKEGCGAILDETYFPESFKGVSFKHLGGMPRAPRRDGDTGTRGISDEQICVMTGVNDVGEIFFDVACRGAMTGEVARRVLADKVGEGAIVSTDRHKSYPRVLRELGAVHDRYGSDDHEPLEAVNNLHSAIKSFINGRFRGVSTKWLSGYLGYFKWMWQFRRSGKDLVRVAAEQIARGGYEHRWRLINTMSLPFRDASMRMTKVRAPVPRQSSDGAASPRKQESAAGASDARGPLGAIAPATARSRPGPDRTEPRYSEPFEHSIAHLSISTLEGEEPSTRCLPSKFLFVHHRTVHPDP